MKAQLFKFAARWLVNSVGIWLAASAFSQVSLSEGFTTVVLAGFLLALVNAILRPTIILLSLPFILLTLGMFMIIVNALVVVIADWLYPGLTLENLSGSLLAGLVIGLVNYIVTISLEGRKKTS